MIEGRFNVSLMGARGLRDEDFWEAKRDGTIMRLLEKLPVEQRCPNVKNRIMDNMAGFLLQRIFTIGNCGWPYYIGDYGPEAALACINLTTHDSEPTYTETWGEHDGSVTINNDSGAATNGAKRFEEDEVTPWEIWAATDGRDAIFFRNRMLYLPSEGVSSDIRSIGIYFCSDGDSIGGYYRALGRIGRVRLKDSGGNPIILNKTASQVLLVEYTFALVSF